MRPRTRRRVRAQRGGAEEGILQLFRPHAQWPDLRYLRRKGSLIVARLGEHSKTVAGQELRRRLGHP
jgi:hypothetical protein